MPRKLLILIAVAALAFASCGGGDKDADDSGGASDAPPVSVAAPDAGHGEELFEATCLACHGQRGVGIAGLGKDMQTSTFIRGISDEDLVAFVTKGRPTSDPLNTTGVEMPARGGNKDLSDQDLFDIVAYIRTVQS
ncbi:MAG: cytochrome c [Acidimicrobiia bacterium]|jgi:disulfide bond formation protein DsbB